MDKWTSSIELLFVNEKYWMKLLATWLNFSREDSLDSFKRIISNQLDRLEAMEGLEFGKIAERAVGG
jgi:hypothetical protein